MQGLSEGGDKSVYICKMDKVQDSSYPTERTHLTLPIYTIRSDISDPCMHIYHSQSFEGEYLPAVPFYPQDSFRSVAIAKQRLPRHRPYTPLPTPMGLPQDS